MNLTEFEGIIVVTGLPRSGTSMMMRMLDVGGVEVLTDHLRSPDEDNPMGYYEFERVKKLKEDAGWLSESKGKAVKMASALLYYLPQGFYYKVIFMLRDIDEILISQRKMLQRLGREDTISDSEMKRAYLEHLKEVREWLSAQPNIDVLYVDYNRTLRDPWIQAESIRRFLGRDLRIKEMVDVVDETLYRNRKEWLSEIKEAAAVKAEKERIHERLRALGYME